MAAVTHDELLQDLSDLLRELEARLDNYVEMSLATATELEDGLLLAVKAQRIVYDAWCVTLSAQKYLIRKGVA